MDFYWLYNLSNLALYFLIVGFITFTGLTKPLFFPDYFEEKLGIEKKFNEFVIGFLSLTGAFLSITMGLIIVGTYETFESCESLVQKESSQLFSLYKTTEHLASNEKEIFKKNIIDYASNTIQKEWPNQQKGIMPSFIEKSLTKLEDGLYNYVPKNPKDEFVCQKLIDELDALIKIREDRLYASKDSLSGNIYFVLILGLLINILVSWQIRIDNKPLEVTIYTLTGILAGSLIYLIIIMDNPFRGEFCVSSYPIENFLETVKYKTYKN